MSTPSEQKREYPSTYFVQDRANHEELQRLQTQDRLLTTGMGGVLPEQSTPNNFQRILDVGCGTGGWLIEAAKTYREIKELVGVDISGKIIDYARHRAEAEQVSDRVKFRTMDVLTIIEFPDDAFDLVNERYCHSFLRIMDWPKFLYTLRRILKAQGTIRLTECDTLIESNSPALTQLCRMLVQAFYQAGHFPTAEHIGMASEIEGMLKQHEFQNVQTRIHQLHYEAGTADGEKFCEDIKHLFRTVAPFIRKWIRVTDSYEAIYQQALHEMQEPGFAANWRLVTAWGNKPGRDRYRPGQKISTKGSK